MSLVHMELSNPKTQSIEHSHATEPQNCLLLETVLLVSAIEVICYFPIFKRVSINVCVEKEHRDNSAGDALVLVEPRFNFHSSPFNLNKDFVWQEYHEFFRI